jgi:DNA-binding NtrC family response regulator
MPYRDTKTLSLREQVQQKYARRASKLLNVFSCLIVSANPRRRQLLERAAVDGGWKTYLCGDPQAASARVHRYLVQLVVVDLEKQSLPAFQPLLEQLAGCGGLLLIVCGNEGSVEEEIWVRQRGAWMYLPGVEDAQDNIGLLCGEAREIAERLWKPGGERAPSQGSV